MPTYGGVHRSWVELHWQHKAQCSSLSAAWMIFISGGMKIAWGIYEQPLVKSQSSVFGEIHLAISWFIGVIIGAKFGAMFVHRMSKNVAHYISGSLVILGGILFISDKCLAILIGRYIDGIAFGTTLLQAIVTGGEVSVRFIRGSVMSTERVFLWIGICIQLCYSTAFFDKLAPYTLLSDDQVHGAIAVVLGVLAVLCTAGFPIESPVYLHINHRESESLNSLMRLHRQSHPTNDLFEIFDDNKLWIRENASQSFKDEIHNGCVAFIKLVFLRSLVSLAMSLPFHWAFVLSTTTSFDSNMFLIIYGLAGLAGTLLSVCFMDCIGRRMTSAFSLCLGGTLLLAVGGIFLEFETTINVAGQMKVVAILLMTYQGINAFGFAPATTIYMAEAFALPLKTCFISGIIVLEYLIQVLTYVLAYTVTINYAEFFIAVGVLNCVGCFIVIFKLPETKKLTLRECNHQFSKGHV